MSAKKKKSGFLEFMSTLPGLLTAVATFITAIAGLYIAFKPDAKPESPNRNATSNTLTPSTNVDGALIEIIKGNGQVRLTDRAALQLVDVDTLKGKSKKNESPSHEFNKNLDDREHIFKEVLSRAGVGGHTVQELLKMSQDEWEKFLDSLDDKQREKVKEIPFAKFNVYIDGIKDETYTQRFYFQGEPLTLSVGDQKVKLEIANILNTKSSVEPESVKVRFR